MKHLGLLGVLNMNSLLRSNFSPFIWHYSLAWPSCSGGKTEVLRACNLTVCCWGPALLISTFFCCFCGISQPNLLACKRSAVLGRYKSTCCGIPSPAVARSSYLQRCVVNQVCSQWYLGVFPLPSAATAFAYSPSDRCV